MLIDNNQKSFIISFREASENDFNNMIKIIGNYYKKLNLPEIHKKKNMIPWIWIKDPCVSFNLIMINEEIAGFFIARTIHLNIHLHSFFIDKKYRRLGLGKKMLFKHWDNGLKKSSKIDTFTLHVHQINKFSASFYKKFGYQKVEQSDDLLILNNGLGSWARNCKTKGQWPLREGIDLYSIKVKRVKTILNNV